MQNITPIYRFHSSCGSTRGIELETNDPLPSIEICLNIIIPNYSEGIPIFADISTSILQRYPISGLFPTAHSLTILLSIYESIDGQRTFYKTVLLATFHWIYIEQLSMLFFISPRVIYIYMIYFKAIGSIYYKIYCKIKRAREEGHVTSRRPSLKKWKMAKVSFTAKISSYLSIKVKRWTWTHALYADCLCSESELTALTIKKKKVGWKMKRTKSFIRSHIAFEVELCCHCNWRGG